MFKVDQKQCVDNPVLFATVSTQQKGVFAKIYDNGRKMDPPLHSRVKLADSCPNNQKHKHHQAKFWPLYFQICKVSCSSITLRKEEPSIANII